MCDVQLCQPAFDDFQCPLKPWVQHCNQIDAIRLAMQDRTRCMGSKMPCDGLVSPFHFFALPRLYACILASTIMTPWGCNMLNLHWPHALKDSVAHSITWPVLCLLPPKAESISTHQTVTMCLKVCLKVCLRVCFSQCINRSQRGAQFYDSVSCYCGPKLLLKHAEFCCV